VLDAAVKQLQDVGVTVAGLQGDVRSPEACQGWVADTLQRYGQLDILVNCAAGNFLANAAELSQGGFKTGDSCRRCVVAPALRARGPGGPRGSSPPCRAAAALRCGLLLRSDGD
jgi:peroxisomal 2,4-dienoyl-CoA reductase